MMSFMIKATVSLGGHAWSFVCSCHQYTNGEVKQMAIRLFQQWAIAFKAKPELVFLVDVYNELKMGGGLARSLSLYDSLTCVQVSAFPLNRLPLHPIC